MESIRRCSRGYIRMMTIDDMKKRKKALGLTNQILAEKSGVPLPTVAKILSMATKSPRINTLLALERALLDECMPSEDEKNTYSPGQYLPNMESEDSLAQEPSGEYHYGSTARKESVTMQKSDPLDESFHTVEEYLALPDERRVELIDGRFYDMASPNGIHQQITFMLWRAFFECIEAHGMPCKVQGAPFDVRLDAYTVVQPDVMVFCEDPSQAFAARATIPPELIIEVLSKSTAFKDRHLKLFKYRHSGVREVWLVSPDESMVEVYLFSDEKEESKTYSFDDKIPVHISSGMCMIDFAEIKKRLPAL